MYKNMNGHQKEKMTANPLLKTLTLISFASLCFALTTNAKNWDLNNNLSAISATTQYQRTKNGELSLPTPPGTKYNNLTFTPQLAVKKNMILRFEARLDAAKDTPVSLAVSFTSDSGKKFWFRESINAQWKSFVYDLSSVRCTENQKLSPEDCIRETQIYTANRQEVPDLDISFSIRNVEFAIAKDGTLSSEETVSYSAIPHFQWAAQETKPEIIQLSRTPDFSDKTFFQTLELSEPQYVPEKPLEAGNWYWRYAMRNPMADRWSDIQKIVIPERSHSFRLPEIDTRALKAKPYPRFTDQVDFMYKLFPPTDEQRAAFEKSATTPLPPDPVPRYQSSLSKIEWLGQIGDQINRTGKSLQRLGEYLVVSTNAAIRKPAKQRLMEAIAWDPSGASSMKDGDLGSAEFLLGICRMFDALESDLTIKERKAVLDGIETRTEQFADAVIPFTLNAAQNHTFKKSMAVGVGAMTLLGTSDRADYWFTSACNIFAYRILPAMGFDGENQEGISYWRYGGQMITDFADLLQAFCGIDLYEHPWLKGTVRFPVTSAPPGGYAISFADTHFHGNSTVRGPYTLFSAGQYIERLTYKTGYPYGSWYLGKLVPEAENQRPPVDTDQSILWKHIGWVQLNTCLPNGFENIAVGLHAGTYFAGHQHADQNSFTINAYGDKLAIDGGYYDWYSSPHFLAYSVQTVAHNSILVNGKGQAWKTDGADGNIDTFYTSIPYDYTVGDASDPDIYEGAVSLFKRKLLFIKPHFIVIHDQLATAEKSAEFNWMIHSHTDDPIPFVQSNRTFSIVRPLARLDGWFVFPKKLNIRSEKSYTVMPLEKRSNQQLADEYIIPEWTLFADAKTKSGQTDYLTVLRVSKTEEPVPSLSIEPFETDAALGAVLSDGTQTWKILSRKANAKPAPVTMNGIDTDADIACIELTADGTVQTAFIGQGTKLTVNDKPVLAQTSIGNAHFNAQKEWHSNHLGTVSLIEGLPPFDAYALQMNDGCLYTYSVALNLDVDTEFTLNLDGIDQPVYSHVNGQIEKVPMSGKFTVKAGSPFLTLSSRSKLAPQDK